MNDGPQRPRNWRTRKRDPLLLGLPSPSLSRINRMKPDQLSERIERLKTEAANVQAKVERLKTVNPQPAERIAELTALVARLVVLQKAARDRLEGKVPQQSHRPRRPFRA